MLCAAPWLAVCAEPWVLVLCTDWLFGLMVWLGPLRLGPADGAGGLAGLQLLYDPAKQAPHAGVVHEAGSAPAADQLVVRTIDVRNAQNLRQKTGKQGCLLYLAMVCMLLT